MGMAMKLADYLSAHPVRYDVVAHSPTASSLESAEATQLPPGCIAKGVVLEDEANRFLMAVLPASRKLRLGELRKRTGHMLRLATEEEMRDRLGDCAAGAVPPLGEAFGMKTLFDESLNSQTDVYFEAGDHATLVHMKMSDFVALLEDVERMEFSEPMGATGARRVL